jgi:fused signal recognition particle receptor
MNDLRSRIAHGLAKTRELLLTDVTELFGAGAAVDADLLDELEDRLLESDLGPVAAADVRARLEAGSRPRDISQPEEVLALIAGVVEEALSPLAKPRLYDRTLESTPHVILMVGVNGSGKTTTIGKLAFGYQKAGRRVLVAAADTYRAAAVEQLGEWAERAGADCVRSQQGADPAAVAWDAVDAAIARGSDVLIVDTAGRLHTRQGLMDELAKIRRVLGKRMEGAPHETILVLDATTGQNAIAQAEAFHRAVDLSGLILTKLDGTARGGVIVPLARRLEIPVEMIGVGEQLEDLRPFSAGEFATALVEGEDGP